MYANQCILHSIVSRRGTARKHVIVFVFGFFVGFSFAILFMGSPLNELQLQYGHDSVNTTSPSLKAQNVHESATNDGPLMAQNRYDSTTTVDLTDPAVTVDPSLAELSLDSATTAGPSLVQNGHDSTTTAGPTLVDVG